MRISELAKRTGVSAHRLRRYESEGLLQAERSESGYREFSERAVREVTFISMGRDLGFSLKYLADMLPRYRAGSLTIDEMIFELQRRVAEVDDQIAAHRALRRRLVSHIGWFRQRQRKAKTAAKSSSTKGASR
jgi:DNA-binding transcriptional MerR regulator